MDRDFVHAQFVRACSCPSDINEHVDTLRMYASQCKSVVEMGVRSGVSTWGCLQGLIETSQSMTEPEPLTLVGIDLDEAPDVYRNSVCIAGTAAVQMKFIQGNSLKVTPEPRDMLFIDTLHVYGQLKRELALHAASTKKFIVLHDTTVDGEVGEAVRSGWNIGRLAESTGIPEAEIGIGLWPAVLEFLDTNSDWRLLKRFTHNNGLTILERTTSTTCADVKLVICVCGQPELISLQTACFKRFMKQSVDVCIVDDSKTEAMSHEIKAIAGKEGHEYLRSPCHGDTLAPSKRHAIALQHGLQNMRKGSYTFIGTMDSDLFLITPLDLDSVIQHGEKDILYWKQTREHITYFWPGCCIWRTDTHNLEDFTWDLCTDRGVPTDTGGTTYYYLLAHPDIKPVEIICHKAIDTPTECWSIVMELLPTSIRDFCIQDKVAADACHVRWWSDVFTDPENQFVFFHLRDVSNWQGIDSSYLASKCARFAASCENLLMSSKP